MRLFVFILAALIANNAGAQNFKLPYPFENGAQFTLAVGPESEDNHHSGWRLNATDFAAAYGTSVTSVANGTVLFVQSDTPDGKSPASASLKCSEALAVKDDSVGLGCMGNFVTILHTHPAYGIFYMSYLHLSPEGLSVSAGQTVQGGEVIGKIGNTGLRSGPHLHIQPGLRLVDRSQLNSPYFENKIADASKLRQPTISWVAKNKEVGNLAHTFESGIEKHCFWLWYQLNSWLVNAGQCLDRPLERKLVGNYNCPGGQAELGGSSDEFIDQYNSELERFSCEKYQATWTEESLLAEKSTWDEMADHYSPYDHLPDVKNPPITAESAETANSQNVGVCRIWNFDQGETERKVCERTVQQKSADHFILTFTWPSGARTVVESRHEGVENGFRVNGKNAGLTNHMGEGGNCTMNFSSNNVFCYTPIEESDVFDQENLIVTEIPATPKPSINNVSSRDLAGTTWQLQTRSGQGRIVRFENSRLFYEVMPFLAGTYSAGPKFEYSIEESEILFRMGSILDEACTFELQNDVLTFSRCGYGGTYRPVKLR